MISSAAPKEKWQDNIKMDFKETVFGGYALDSLNLQRERKSGGIY